MASHDHAQNKQDKVESPDTDADPGLPREPLFLVLAYLPLLELLSMSKTCKSLRDALNNDILPWLNILIDTPLNSRVSDEILIRIASRANGRLGSLVLNNCVNITDNGLHGVIAQNPCINKLHVPSCTSLTPEGIIRAVMTLNSTGPQLTSLKINGIYNLKREHLETLHGLLGTGQAQQHQQHKKKRNIYTEHNLRREEETDNCSIDVEICPKCNEVRMVFDCPDEDCKRKRIRKLRECRGCTFCIPRCEECGKCIKFEEECEVACADMLCEECWLRLPKCDFCNRPYCNQHAYKQCTLPESSRFVCETCHQKFIRNSG